MTLFSYVVHWDHGFAPNPFFGVCTLATCKPRIRKKAELGDWIVGTGGARRPTRGRAIFVMRVTEISNFDDYWRDERFKRKRPIVEGSYKVRFGDNIYHREGRQGDWIQADSRHSKDNAIANLENLKRDTRSTDRVLISDDFIFWGDQAPMLPRGLEAIHIARQNHKDDFSENEVAAFHSWVKGLNVRGRVGDPVDWADRYAKYWK